MYTFGHEEVKRQFDQAVENEAGVYQTTAYCMIVQADSTRKDIEYDQEYHDEDVCTACQYSTDIYYLSVQELLEP